ncbi:hypothetical protein WA158_004149 [Blastocystis sp. Blastoise]
MSEKTAEPQGVDITSLNPQQLVTLQNQVESEMTTFASNFKQLKLAEGFFKRSQFALNCMKPENQDHEIMIPLTTSVYVPGKIEDIDHCLVGVGTGYFVEKTIPEASDFFTRKIEMVQKNESTVEKLIDEKRRALEVIIGYRNALTKELAKAQTQKQ